MKKSLLRVALNHAEEHLFTHPQLSHFPHFSYIVMRNRIISWATNTSKEPPIHFGYHRNWDGSYRPKLHAELNAYHKANIHSSFEIINIRLSKSKELRLSKPCYACFKLLRTHGCQRFWYSDLHGFEVLHCDDVYKSHLYSFACHSS